MDDVLDRLARQQSVALPLDERGGELTFEAEGHGQVARVMTIAAPDDAQHAQPGFAMTARRDFRNRRRQIVPFTGSSPAPVSC
jgi:hypothetical protein